MTIIHDQPSPSDGAADALSGAESHLAPGRLRSRSRALRHCVWMVPAAAGLAGLAVFGLDVAGGTQPPDRPASREAPAKPATTGNAARPPSPGAEQARPAPPSAVQTAAKPPAPGPVDAHGNPAASAVAVPAPVVGESRIAAAPALESRPPAPREAPQAPALKLSPDEIAVHLDRGEDKLKRGELAAARLYFERAARAGDQRGALGMARSYDASVLAGLPVIGPQADAAAARLWYQRAETQRAAR